MIKLRDRNSIVSYLQIYLKTVYPTPYLVNENSISPYNNKELKVTGSYDIQTYLCLSCYMANYYPNEGFPYYYVKDGDDNIIKVEYGQKDPITEEVKSLKEVLDYNIDNLLKINSTYNIDERVMSYVFEEVVTDLSEEDEVFRIQKLIYGDKFVPKEYIGNYDSIRDYIKSVQSKRIEQGGLVGSYKDFKVTSYCDPWTERLLVEGRS